MGAIHRTHAVHLRPGALLAGAALALACAGTAPPTPPPPIFEQGPPAQLPGGDGWGVHVLAMERSPDGSVWVGTYGRGIYVMQASRLTASQARALREGMPVDPTPGRGRGEQAPRAWRHIPADSTALSWGYINSIAFEDSATIWYGTIGNGFGRSTDGGRTWRNWTFSQLGPEWQYIAPDGIVAHGDTVYVATADGLRITRDGGANWRCIQDAGRTAGGAQPREDGCTERIASLPTEYLLALDVGQDGTIYAGHLRGLSISTDFGQTWRNAGGLAGRRIRAVLADSAAVWAATEDGVYVDSAGGGDFVEAAVRVPGFQRLPGSPRDFTHSPAGLPPVIATSYGMVARTNEGGYRAYYIGSGDRYRPVADIWAAAWWGPPAIMLGGAASGLNRILAGDLPVRDVFATDAVALPAEPRHLWFQRPIDGDGGNPHIDATYRYGSTMGGNFQQHQGVEFNNPAGTPVRAIGDGTVVFAGPAEAGANTVAIRHDRQLDAQHVFSTYYHNTSLDVRAGQRVTAGQVIARVGNTGRATNDHLHLEVHVAPQTDSSRIVHPDVRFPPHTVNPQLWIAPLPGTGIVAGRVLDASGNPVPGARIHGLVLAYPEETPFSFAETYGDRGHPDPAYGENFAVGDVPAGEYTLGVVIGEQRVWRRVRVEPGMVSWVEFRGS